MVNAAFWTPTLCARPMLHLDVSFSFGSFYWIVARPVKEGSDINFTRSPV
jgi:hypothetical protein